MSATLMALPACTFWVWTLVVAVRSLSSTVEVPLAVEAFWLRLARATAPPLTPPPTMAQARHRAINLEGVQPFLGFLGLGPLGGVG